MSEKRSVFRYDEHGNLLSRYSSIKEAQALYHCTHISSVCRGQRNKDGGFIWRYADDAGEKKEVPAPKEKAKTARS